MVQKVGDGGEALCAVNSQWILLVIVIVSVIERNTLLSRLSTKIGRIKEQEFSEFIRAGIGLYKVMKLVLK